MTVAVLVLMAGAKAKAGTCPSDVPAGVTNCFFVSYAHGSDSNSGTTENAAWQHAPGMQGCTGNCNITPSAGTGIILQGCVTWPNSSFTWTPAGTGTSGSPIYYGVDKSWWDSTVAGCASAWNRPIFNLGNAAVTDSLQRIIVLGHSYLMIDNFEITNISDRDSGYSGENETHVFDIYGGTTTNVTVQNCYIHGWKSEFFAIGTGNIVSGQNQITNFVPLSYSPMPPASTWPSQSSHIVVGDVSGGTIPQTGNGTVLSGISGSNPYTITWTGNAASGTCNGCIFTVGGDFLRVFVGNETGNPGTVVQNNVIDGSDSTAALINPYSDCGLSEGNNNWCGTSGIAQWRGPQIWRNNVIRYIQSGAVGACTEWSGNLIEDIRLSTNASAHTNGVECLDVIPANNTAFFYGNVIRHTNKANPATPGGLQSIGLLTEFSPPNGSTLYVFNNVVYDTLQNVWVGMPSGTTGCQSNCGSAVVFNNSSDCGPSWNHSFPCINSCPPIFASCTIQNNHWITNASSQFSGSGCGSNCTATSELVQTVSKANGQGYLTSTTYAYSPGSNGSTLNGLSTSLSTCTAISLVSVAAGTACLSDTPYAVSYNSTAHTVVIPARSPVLRPPTGNWAIGAYQSSSGSASAPAAPTGLLASVN